MILLVWTLLFFLQRVGVGGVELHNGCISEKFCTCSEDGEEEICSDDTQTETLNVGMLHQPSLTSITIRGFRWVNINDLAFALTDPKTVKLTNISNLQIKQYAFSGRPLSDLEITHIGNLVLETNAITLPHNSVLSLYNVTTKYVKSKAIRGFNLTVVALDCDLGVMYSNAVYAYQYEPVVNLSMKNTQITSLEEGAFNLKTEGSAGSSVVFSNVSFGKISRKAFLFTTLSELSFEDCHFGMISSGFVSGKGINAFRFFRNTVNSSDQGLFEELEAARVDIENNDFVDMYNMSLPLQEVQQGWRIYNNVFRCNCSTLWLLQASPEVLEVNLCIIDGSTKQVYLSDVESAGEGDLHSKCLGVSVESSGILLFLVVFVMSAIS